MTQTKVKIGFDASQAMGFFGKDLYAVVPKVGSNENFQIFKVSKDFTSA